jgi:hypothetical protein
MLGHLAIAAVCQCRKHFGVDFFERLEHGLVHAFFIALKDDPSDLRREITESGN